MERGSSNFIKGLKLEEETFYTLSINERTIKSVGASSNQSFGIRCINP